MGQVHEQLATIKEQVDRVLGGPEQTPTRYHELPLSWHRTLAFGCAIISAVSWTEAVHNPHQAANPLLRAMLAGLQAAYSWQQADIRTQPTLER